MKAIENWQSKQSFLTIIEVLIPLFFVIIGQVIYIRLEGLHVTSVGLQIFCLESALYFYIIFVLFPDLFPRKRYLLFAIKLLMSMVTYLFLRGFLLFHHLFTAKFIEVVFSTDQLIYAFTHVFFILGMGFFVGLYRERKNLYKKNEITLKSNLDAMQKMRSLENTLYQMQLNPHLIFNVLTAIKQETKEKLPEVSKAIELLADIHKYYLIDPVANPNIPLVAEVAAVNCLCDIEHYLRGENFHVILRMEITDNNFTIPFGILTNLIDNLFRYGVTNDPDFPALIDLKLETNTLTLHTRNLKRMSIIKGNGYGQKNVIALLDHNYLDNYNIKIEESEDYYDLKLQIDL